MGQAAFAVIGKQNGLVLRQERAKLVGLRGQHFGLRGVLEVGAQQLLLAANHAQLDGGFELRVTAQARRDAGLGQQGLELVTGVVVTHHAQKADLRAQRDHVVGHVGTATQAVFLARHAHHGHGGFGADAVHRAVPIAVEHHIADHQHLGLRESFKRGQVHSSSIRRGG